MEEQNREKKSLWRELLEWVICIVVAVLITLVLRNFVFSLVRVEGSSMAPTLSDGDRLVMIRLGYTPQRGDIVVVDPDNGSIAPYIKRIIGMPGDVIEFTRGYAGDVMIEINGDLQEEEYISSEFYSGQIGEGSYIVPEEHVFVMGDNRPNSKDSRNSSVGCIPYKNVLGETVFRIWPLDKIGKP